MARSTPDDCCYLRVQAYVRSVSTHNGKFVGVREFSREEKAPY